MDEEFFTKIWLIFPWILAIVVTFVLGVPWLHAVSSMDTALYQVAEMAKTGATDQELNTEAYQYIGMSLPYQFDSTVLFNTNDMHVIPDVSGISETIELVYNYPIFAPIVSVLGMSGPTIPMVFKKMITLSSANDDGVNYLP